MKESISAPITAGRTESAPKPYSPADPASSEGGIFSVDLDPDLLRIVQGYADVHAGGDVALFIRELVEREVHPVRYYGRH